MDFGGVAKSQRRKGCMKIAALVAEMLAAAD